MANTAANRGGIDGDYDGHILHQCCLYNNDELLADLLLGVEKQNINSCDVAGRSVLYTAVSNGSYGCCKLLLENGANPNISCTRFNNMTPLHQAALDGKADLVQLLLEYGANWSARDASGLLPKDIAIVNQGSGGQHNLYPQATREQLDQCVQLLKEATQVVLYERMDAKQSSIIRQPCISSPSPAHYKLRKELYAVEHCDLAVCDKLVEQLGWQSVAEILNDRRKEDRVSIFTRACVMKRADMVQWLIDHNVHPIIDPTSNLTPLHAAAKENCHAVVRILLNMYPHFISCVSNDCMGSLHPLHYAAAYGDVELISLLMDYEYSPKLMDWVVTPNRKHCYKSAFDVNAQNLTNWTPLYFATKYRKPDIVNYLMSTQVLAHTLPGCLCTSSCVRELSSYALEESLQDSEPPAYICPVDTCVILSVEGLAPLHVAVIGEGGRGYCEIAQLLLEHGADVNQTCDLDGDGHLLTPLMIAIKQKDEDMVSLLLKNGAKDQQNKILMNCISENSPLTELLLKHKAKHDQSIKIQPKQIGEYAASHPVAINWHGLAFSGKIQEVWLEQTAQYLNPGKSPSCAVNCVTSIDVSHCGLVELPEVLFYLPSLTVLKASHNELSSLPDAKIPWKAESLKEVFLGNNKLESVSEAMFALPCLENLSLCENKLTSVPYRFWLSAKLRDVDLSYNDLESLPWKSEDSRQVHKRREHPDRSSVMEGQGMLEEDVFDGISHPPPMPHALDTLQIKKIAHVVSGLSELVRVIDIPETTKESDTPLIHLNLSHNRFVSIPEGLPCLAPKLEKLNLSHNRLEQMGTPSLYPARLKTLILNDNQIKVQISQSDLESTFLNGATECLSPSRKSCSFVGGLQSRNNSNSSLMNVCCHKVSRFEYLETLKLCSNQLTELIFTQGHGNDQLFPKLTNLAVSCNRIARLPPSIADLACLSELNLSYNSELRELPPQMGRLKNFWHMDLKGCNLDGPLATMVDAKTTDIIGFLKSILQDAKPYTSMKLMVVGNCNVGKTSILTALRQQFKTTNVAKFLHFTSRMFDESTPAGGVKGDSISTVGIDIGDLVIGERERKVTFKTWDFGGQEEYYATHQYFLSKRSVYLVVWKITDGEKAFDNIKQWLVNIQSRCPGAHVLIVGTHLDMAKKLKINAEELKDKLFSRFLVPDPAAAGLPNVHREMIEVSKSSSATIKKLGDTIYNLAWSVKATGNTTVPLLTQKIPAIYIELEKRIEALAQERKEQKRDPVLKTAEYREAVGKHIQFRDTEELNQATQFLHDNGVMLHYQDVALSDLYFLNPQWLCDILANVIAVKEINPYVKQGIMPLDKLHELFRRSTIYQPDDLETYIVSLMSKFEVALVWDHEHLLIPSLLPSKESAATLIPVRKPDSRVRKSLKRLYRRVGPVMPSASHNVCSDDEHLRSVDSNDLHATTSSDYPIEFDSYVSADASKTIRRVYVLAYVPSGFWPRLISRIYHDQFISGLSDILFDAPSSFAQQMKHSWQCWKTGLALQYVVRDLLRVRQVFADDSYCDDFLSSKLQFPDSEVVKVSDKCLLEIEVPDNNLEVSIRGQPVSYRSRLDIRAKLLTKVIDHVETLLEDWYPDLGALLTMNNEGRYLVSRIVPCPDCVTDHKKHTCARADAQEVQSSDGGFLCWLPRPSPSVLCKTVCFKVEAILADIYKGADSVCPDHGPLVLAEYAPDLVFEDINMTVKLDEYKNVKVLGKGGYGVVFSAQLHKLGTEVALKTVHPQDPGTNATRSVLVMHQQMMKTWDQEPAGKALAAYMITRQELNNLCLLQHQNIVPLLGVVLRPLSIALALAPHGSLFSVLQRYLTDGTQLSPYSIKHIALQVSLALVYLHSEGIIYRDLKAENVLVWSMPLAHKPDCLDKVDVKLADMGASRFVVSVSGQSVTKGLAGTPGYMAPEIIEFKGNESYTEKVDCYSFGVLLYELLTLRRPFWNEDVNANTYTLAGKRPSVSSRELSSPKHVLDLMDLCWHQEAKSRPSAEAVKAVASSPQFCRVKEVVQSDSHMFVKHCALARTYGATAKGEEDLQSEREPNHKVVLCGYSSTRAGRVGSAEIYTYDCNANFLASQILELPESCSPILFCCPVGGSIWLADQSGAIRVVDILSGCSIYRTVFAVTDSTTVAEIKSLMHDAAADLVYCVLENGDILDFCATTAECLAVRLRLSKRCHSSVLVNNNLWVGNNAASISVIHLTGSRKEQRVVVPRVKELNHFEPVQELVDTTLLIADSSSVWSYVYPGSTIYRWDAVNMRCTDSRGISKLIPQLEASDLEGLPPTLCQVTALEAINNFVVVGTTWGCILVLDGKSLIPVTCMKPHGGEPPFVTGILGLFDGSEKSARNTPYMLTVGSGYCDLITEKLQLKKQQEDNRKDSGLYTISWFSSHWGSY